ncbi:hypothetical protein P7C70_g2671, partial [Phenoliferia sp. Uapishka_3]
MLAAAPSLPSEIILHILSFLSPPDLESSHPHYPRPHYNLISRAWYHPSSTIITLDSVRQIRSLTSSLQHLSSPPRPTITTLFITIISEDRENTAGKALALLFKEVPELVELHIRLATIQSSRDSRIDPLCEEMAMAFTDLRNLRKLSIVDPSTGAYKLANIVRLLRRLPLLESLHLANEARSLPLPPSWPGFPHPPTVATPINPITMNLKTLVMSRLERAETIALVELIILGSKETLKILDLGGEKMAKDERERERLRGMVGSVQGVTRAMVNSERR